jgi:SagB-type dehydrogenase family enzyme
MTRTMRRLIKYINFITLSVSIIFLHSHIWGDDVGTINLPEPKTTGKVSVEEAIQNRRSVRSYSGKDISLEDISQLLWSCQGITSAKQSLRAAPSAGALYPLEVYLVKKDGLFHYMPEGHKIERIADKDLRRELADASYGQVYVEQAGIDIVITAVYERVTSKYGNRGIRYTDMEAGHAAQNVFLEAVSLGLSSVPIGAFDDNAVTKILNLPKDAKPLYILPVGYKE